MELLDGGVGAELELRGTGIPAAPWWSAAALRDCPEVVRSVHKDYIDAGAQYHTTNTFRTQRPSIGEEWEHWARIGVRLLRNIVEPPLKVCASIAPLGHCYTINATPSHLFSHFEELTKVFVDEGADVLLCETFCSKDEVYAAAEAATNTSLPVWVAITPGPDGSVLTPTELHEVAACVVPLGIDKILVNCISASKALPYVEAIADFGIPFGVYANAGDSAEGIGWEADESGSKRYLEYAQTWVEAGATVIGGCCGIRPQHIKCLSSGLR